MATWNNLDTLASYEKLAGLKNYVDIKEAMAGENGAERVAKYTAPMAEGLSFNYAAKQVDDTVLTALTELAEEAQLAEKFEELYNGAVINTGEKRLVLHHLAQLLHQGTDIVPLQFVGFKNSQIGMDVVIEDSTSQQKLCANVAAQIVAFACGKKDENLNKNFEGGRPSSIIIGDQLTPESLGALLAHFENKIMFQGFVWNVNSFDQEGVQLGKVLAKRVLAHDTDGALKAYSDLLNI